MTATCARYLFIPICIEADCKLISCSCIFQNQHHCDGGTVNVFKDKKYHRWKSNADLVAAARTADSHVFLSAVAGGCLWTQLRAGGVHCIFVCKTANVWIPQLSHRLNTAYSWGKVPSYNSISRAQYTLPYTIKQTWIYHWCMTLIYVAHYIKYIYIQCIFY